EHAARHVRVADGAQQDRVVLADRREIRVREGLARAVPARRPEVELGGAHGHVRAAQRRIEDGEPLLDHFRTDAVAGNHGEIHVLDHARHATPRPTWRTPHLSAWNARGAERSTSWTSRDELPRRETNSHVDEPT